MDGRIGGSAGCGGGAHSEILASVATDCEVAAVEAAAAAATAARPDPRGAAEASALTPGRRGAARPRSASTPASVGGAGLPRSAMSACDGGTSKAKGAVDRRAVGRARGRELAVSGMEEGVKCGDAAVFGQG
jgi:hypothetical protein